MIRGTGGWAVLEKGAGRRARSKCLKAVMKTLVHSERMGKEVALPTLPARPQRPLCAWGFTGEQE